MPSPALSPLPPCKGPDRKAGATQCLPTGDGIAAPCDGHHILSRHHRVVLALEHAVPSLPHFHRLLCAFWGDAGSRNQWRVSPSSSIPSRSPGDPGPARGQCSMGRAAPRGREHRSSLCITASRVERAIPCLQTGKLRQRGDGVPNAPPCLWSVSLWSLSRGHCTGYHGFQESEPLAIFLPAPHYHHLHP